MLRAFCLLVSGVCLVLENKQRTCLSTLLILKIKDRDRTSWCWSSVKQEQIMSSNHLSLPCNIAEFKERKSHSIIMSLSLMNTISNPETQGIRQRHPFNFVSKSFLKISFSLFFMQMWSLGWKKKINFPLRCINELKPSARNFKFIPKNKALKVNLQTSIFKAFLLTFWWHSIIKPNNQLNKLGKLYYYSFSKRSKMGRRKMMSCMTTSP